MPLNRRAFEVAALVVALALLSVMAWLALQARDWLLPNGQPVFGDFIAFWGAGRAALDGAVALVHEPSALQAYQREGAPGFDLYAPWNSPPPFLLIVSALALLPYPVAALLFLAGSGSIYVAAARKLAPDALIFALTLPAAVYHLGTVQTGLLIAGISGLAFHWLDTRPRLAGALVGLLAIKPHLAILWPVLLALTGRWRAFLAAALSTLAFVLLAGLVFGFESYARFFDNLGDAQALIGGQRVATPAYASFYAWAVAIGLPPVVTTFLHGAVAATAIVGAVLVWRRDDACAQGAALCAATLLLSPYLFFYDFTLLAVGAALLGAPRNRLALAACILTWSAGLSLALNYLAPVPLCPIAAMAVLLSALLRAGSAAPGSAPAPRR